MLLEPRLVRRRLGPRLRVIPLLVRQLEASGCVDHIGRHYLVAFGGIAVHVVRSRREAVRFAHKILRNPCAEPERCVLNTKGSAKATITIPLLPRLNSTNNSRVPCRRRCANARRHAPLKQLLCVCAPLVHGGGGIQNQEEVQHVRHFCSPPKTLPVNLNEHRYQETALTQASLRGVRSGFIRVLVNFSQLELWCLLGVTVSARRPARSPRRVPGLPRTLATQRVSDTIVPTV